MTITPEQLASAGTEHAEQSALFCHAAIMARTRPLWALLYAIPNGGKRDIVTATRLKAEGVKKGFPDIGLPVARGGYHALYIELKRVAQREKDRKAGVASDNQKGWKHDLEQQGNCCLILYGWIEAKSAIETYLSWAATGVFWYNEHGEITSRVS